MKSYREIDIDEMPIVVLGCSYFFTAESLNGLIGMSEVYEVDRYGEFTGLKDVSVALAQAIPCCPDCNYPVRQFATQRYNRVINRAVMDEMSKWFLTTGRDELRELEQWIVKMEQDLDITQEEIVNSICQAKTHLTLTLTPAKILEITRALKEQHVETRKLESAIKIFCNSATDKHQPSQKLHKATVHAVRKVLACLATLEVQIANLAVVDTIPTLTCDCQITMGGQMVKIKTEFVILNDKFIIAQALKSIPTLIKIPGGAPSLLAIPFFQICKNFIDECNVENLPKLAVEVSLFYASIACSFETFCHSAKINLNKAVTHVEMTKQLLENA
jgi:hypothetical protein